MANKSGDSFMTPARSRSPSAGAYLLEAIGRGQAQIRQSYGEPPVASPW